MVKLPTGTPEPMLLEKWSAQYQDFMGAMRGKYRRTSEQHIFDSWNKFLRTYLPTLPNTEPPKPSDNVLDYIRKMGSNFAPPLSSYLYGPNPSGFYHLHTRNCCDSTFLSSCVPESSTLNTAFCDAQYAGKATWVDQLIKAVVVQDTQTIPHRNNAHPLRRWIFEFPEMLQGVVVKIKTLNKVTRKYEYPFYPGRIVAMTKDDIDHQSMYRVRKPYVNYESFQTLMSYF